MTLLLIGVCANGTIVVVNGIESITRRKMAPLDLLLCCLATSRICQQSLFFFSHLANVSLMNFLVVLDSFPVFFFVNSLEIWLATWLGVFYCVKIATIPHPAFLWLKMRIGKMVLWLILGSVLFVSISTGIQSKYTLDTSKEFLVSFVFTNDTRSTEKHSGPLTLLLTEFMLPLLIFLASALLLIFSLGRHTYQMRTLAAGTRHLRNCTHTRALLSILSFLILYFFHYSIGVVFCLVLDLRSPVFLFCTLLVGAYPSVHSVILILGNPKLKQNTKKLLLQAKCYQ
ncbi:taste receptor type 2 member 1-like [Ctenodactylus gundi]